MGLSCTKEQGLKKEKVQGPKKKHAHLRVWRKLRKFGKKDKAVLSMDNVSGDLAKGTEDHNLSPGPKSSTSDNDLVKLIPDQVGAPKSDGIIPVEDRERSGGGLELTGEDQEKGEQEKGPPVEDMENGGGGQESTGEDPEKGEQEKGPPVEDMENGGGGQEPTGEDPEMGGQEKGPPVEDTENGGGGQEPTGEDPEMGGQEQGPPVEDPDLGRGEQGLLVNDPDLAIGVHGSFEEDPEWGRRGQGPHRHFFRLLQSIYNVLIFLIFLAVDFGDYVFEMSLWFICYMISADIEID